MADAKKWLDERIQMELKCSCGNSEKLGNSMGNFIVDIYDLDTTITVICLERSENDRSREINI